MYTFEVFHHDCHLRTSVVKVMHSLVRHLKVLHVRLNIAFHLLCAFDLRNFVRSNDKYMYINACCNKRMKLFAIFHVMIYWSLGENEYANTHTSDIFIDIHWSWHIYKEYSWKR